jgi:hypothetical protein
MSSNAESSRSAHGIQCRVASWVGTVGDWGLLLAAAGLFLNRWVAVVYINIQWQGPECSIEKEVWCALLLAHGKALAASEMPLLETRLASTVHLAKSGKTCTCSRRRFSALATGVPALDAQLGLCAPQAGGDDRGSVGFWCLVLGHLAEAGWVVSEAVESVLYILEAS